jgi:GAF domain-containing protein
MGLLRRQRPTDDVDVDSFLSNLDRLQALEEAQLLRSSLRPELDELARTAAMRLRTPMALMSILNDETLFMAGAYGLEGRRAATRQLRAEESYCQHVVAYDDVLVVNNATTDPLVAHNIGTRQRGIRSYLGVPVRYKGQCLGAFCVIDNRPRQWTDEDLEALQWLADAAVALAPPPTTAPPD